jgi:hypothetical protein
LASKVAKGPSARQLEPVATVTVPGGGGTPKSHLILEEKPKESRLKQTIAKASIRASFPGGKSRLISDPYYKISRVSRKYINMFLNISVCWDVSALCIVGMISNWS